MSISTSQDILCYKRAVTKFELERSKFECRTRRGEFAGGKPVGRHSFAVAKCRSKAVVKIILRASSNATQRQKRKLLKSGFT